MKIKYEKVLTNCFLGEDGKPCAMLTFDAFKNHWICKLGPDISPVSEDWNTKAESMTEEEHREILGAVDMSIIDCPLEVKE